MRKSIRNLFILTSLLTLLLSSCYKQRQELTILPNTDSIGEWLLREKITSFESKLKDPVLPTSTNLSKNDYLKVIEAQVKVMQQYQDSLGRIIDPVEGVEKYYTTPCYAHSVAILASSAYTNDAALIESGMKALDNTCEHLRRQFAPGNHGDFFTWPVVFAYKHFKNIADSARYNKWGKAIREIEPSKFYAFYRKYNLNWNLVHSAGEFMRYKEGFTDISYIDTCLLMQKKHFTAYGLYNEHGNPLAYDLFARHYVAGVLVSGYKGKLMNDYKEIIWKGAWMSLFMQSPSGEIPTGYRSSHHIWNEAEQAMLFEIYAAQYAQAGNTQLAGVFKRAALLSLKNIKDWIRPDGSGYIVKNKFPIDKRHGYETYSMHSCYNMLATSMLAQAYEFASDAKETVCPADIGGYVLPVLEPFHKIFASVKGNYLQYDTRGDQSYNPTGILRIHLNGTSPQLGPSDGIASLWNEKETSFALGPHWQNTDGSWSSLAEQKQNPDLVKVLFETSDSVAFKVEYHLEKGIHVSETILLKEDKVIVKNSIKGNDGLKRISWPILIDNGINKSEIEVNKQSITNTMDGYGIRLEYINAINGAINIPEKEYNHRNGIAKVGFLQFEGNEITYTLSAKKQ